MTGGEAICPEIAKINPDSMAEITSTFVQIPIDQSEIEGRA
jgi:hypothetical protein